MNQSNSLDTNLEKSYPLEFATAAALDNLNIEYEDFTGIYNFHSYDGNKHVPDFLTVQYLIEDKNWDCENYYVNHVKTYNEIFKRWVNFLDYKPVLIVSKPRWIKREKAWLYAMGWKILELGYFVTWNNFDRAVHDITIFFLELYGAYVNTDNTKISNNINSSSKDENKDVKCEFRNKVDEDPPCLELNSSDLSVNFLDLILDPSFSIYFNYNFKEVFKRWNFPNLIPKSLLDWLDMQKDMECP